MTATTPTRAVQAAARLDPRSDAELLGRFLASADDSAFATLVQRHGPLVYGVCRRALGATADADDAFQATFLVLVKRAASVPWRANLGPWLYGVAHRVSAKARFRRDRRFALEKQVDAMPHPETTAWEPDDLSRLFDEELAKLPEEMRRAVVLCELQGLSRSAAAKQLRISEGTLSSRLGRARKKLAAALTARGVKLSIPVAAGLSGGLAAATVRAATDPAGAVPAAVSYLVQEALTAMAISKLKLGVVLAAMAVGCTWAALAADPKPITPPAVKAEERIAPPAKADVPKADEPAKKNRLELSIDLKLNPEPVATVNGKDIKREEFAEYLIRKYGAKEIEQFVNQRIIQDAAAEKEIRIPAGEVVAAFEADAKAAGVSREQFVKEVLPRVGKTEHEWWTEVLTPRLMLAKLLDEQVKVTEEDLKKLFQRKYGETRKVQIVQFTKGGGRKQAEDLYARAKKEPLLFDQLCTRVSVPGRPEERVLVLHKGVPVFGDEAVSDAAFALTEVDEVSRLVPVAEGWCAVKLVEIVPAQKDKSFEKEKTSLRAEATAEKAQAAMPKLFEKLKKEAKPVYHIQPEPKTYSVPLPKK